MIPVILYLSVKTGELVLNEKVNLNFSRLLTLQTLNNLYVYAIGAIVLSVFTAFAGFIITWGLLKLFKYKPVTLPK